MKRRRKDTSRTGWRVVRLAVAVTVVTMGYLLYFGPIGGGGPAAFRTVRGISMTPTLHNGDLVVAEQQSHYGRGDIIMFRIPAGQPFAGLTVTHRIVGGDSLTGFVTKGDHNRRADPWRIGRTDVLGQLEFTVPHLGGWLAGPDWWPLAAIAFGLTGLSVLLRRMSRPHARTLVPSQ